MTGLGLGGVLGSFVMSVWGGPKQRMRSIAIGLLGVGICGYLVFGFGRSLPIWVMGTFGLALFVPLMSASQEALWLIGSPKAFVGRIFAARQTLSSVYQPLLTVLTTLTADHVFEKEMIGSSVLSSMFASLIGTGPGSGMAAMFILASGGAVLLSLLLLFLLLFTRLEYVLINKKGLDQAESSEFS